ncbi:MAG: hypothetical protein JNL50_02320 [Phycisphaerae bacterium]|nr:hypothetical protein [Phycisphaerae bacterium]
MDIVESEPRGESGPASAGDRPYLRVFFSCANQYVRVYRDRAGAGYTAQCPTCGKRLKFRVGDGGTAQRFFELSCRR